METIATFRQAMAQIMKGRMAFHGVKQAETAEAIGISQSQLSKILRADRPIDLETFEAFCAFLGDDAASLVAQGQALTDARKNDPADGTDAALASASTVAGRVVVSDTKTYESRIIMYPEMLDGMMRHRCEGRGDDDLLFDAPHRPGEYLSNADGPTSPDGWFAVALRRAGIDKGHMTVHDLRHTAASLMVSAGANVKAVQRQLGHRSAAMTLDTYADLFDDDLDDLSAAMSDMLARENVGKMWAAWHGC